MRFDVNDAGLRHLFLGSALPLALAQLAPGRAPRWGRMTAQQMVEHLLWSFEVSTGRTRVACPVPEERRPALRAFLHHDRPTPQGFMNPLLEEGLPALRFSQISEAVAVLSLEVERFLEQVVTSPGAVHTHPVFGPIGVEEWSRAHFKHCCHHLLQFRLIEVDD